MPRDNKTVTHTHIFQLYNIINPKNDKDRNTMREQATEKEINTNSGNFRGFHIIDITSQVFR